jgi:hypothetical protein
MSASALDPAIRLILVSRVDNLGDVVMVVPALRWIRQCHPGVRIEMVVREYAVPLVQRIQDVDRVWTPRQVEQAAARGESPPDAVFHLQASRPLKPDCVAWGIRVRVGNLFRSAYWRYCNRWVAFSKRRLAGHESWMCWRYFRAVFAPAPSAQQWQALLERDDWFLPGGDTGRVNMWGWR